MHDWWFLIIATVTGFLAAWGVFQLTERRRRKAAQAVMRRAVVTELSHAELVLSCIIFNLSIGTDNPADAVRELKGLLEIGTERVRRAGVLDLTTEQLDALRHLQGVADPGAAEILRTFAPALHARPLRVQVPVLDYLVANPAPEFRDVELQALTAIRWQMHLLADEARLADAWLPLAGTTGVADDRSRAVTSLNGTQESYRRRAMRTVQMIRDVLPDLKGARGPRQQAARIRRVRRRQGPPRAPAS